MPGNSRKLAVRASPRRIASTTSIVCSAHERVPLWIASKASNASSGTVAGADGPGSVSGSVDVGAGEASARSVPRASGPATNLPRRRAQPSKPLTRPSLKRSQAATSGPGALAWSGPAYSIRRQLVPSNGYASTSVSGSDPTSGDGDCARPAGVPAVASSASTPRMTADRTTHEAGRVASMGRSIRPDADRRRRPHPGRPGARGTIRRREPRRVRPAGGGAPGHSLDPPGGPPMPAPRVAASPGELLALLSGIAHVEGDALVIDDEAAFRAAGHPRRRLDGHVQRGRGDDRGGALDRLGGVAGARRALGEHPRPVHGPRPRRGRRVHGAGHQPADPGLRHGRGRDLPGGRRARCGHGHLRARAQRAGVHLPAPRRVHHERPRGLPSRPAGRAPSSSRATTTSSTPRSTRPTPTASRETLRKATVDALGGRLRQHRHRLVDAGRPVAADASTSSSAPTTARGRALGAHPRASEDDGLAVSIGGEIGEVGKQNSTEEELRAYLDGYPSRARCAAPVRTPSACPR